jgi:hypothetical protein
MSGYSRMPPGLLAGVRVAPAHGRGWSRRPCGVSVGPTAYQWGYHLHDVGLVEGHRSDHDRFEIDRANAARDCLERHSLPEERVMTVWDAIALHTTREIPRLLPRVGHRPRLWLLVLHRRRGTGEHRQARLRHQPGDRRRRLRRRVADRGFATTAWVAHGPRELRAARAPRPRRRANGELHVESSPPEGAVIAATIPMPASHAARGRGLAAPAYAARRGGGSRLRTGSSWMVAPPEASTSGDAGLGSKRGS